MEFDRAYKRLDDDQKQAVEQIDGPVLVIAGPGTGKTELLALRAANILKKDPTVLPGNILCLTFTDKAAENLRERLIRYIGQDAYRIGVYTFHSFGAHIMSLYPEYFFAWRETKTADSLTTHRLLEKILADLPGDSELAERSLDGIFYSMRQIKNLVFDAKSSNVSPADLKAILNANLQVCQDLTPKIRELWPPSMSSAGLEQISKLVDWVSEQKPDKQVVESVAPLKNMIFDSLLLAASESASYEKRAKTKPFTAWKEAWLTKDDQGQWIFKVQQHSAKLLEVCEVYQKYQDKLSSGSLADFSDQISWTLKALSEHPALRLNLQERYQYIMLDEFQDTNRPQLQMARYLTDSAAHEGAPNILAVGDDDQAIFRFQGADIANIEEFEASFPRYKTIKLSTNYRSNEDILKNSAKINSQIEFSLAKQKGLSKKLTAKKELSGSGVVLNEFATEAEHYSWVAEQIKAVAKQTTSREIAVLARERAQLDSLMPYLRHLSVPVNYERRENVLDQEHIVALLSMARLVSALAQKKLDEANALLPQVISEPMWGIKPSKLWEISIKAYKEKKHWLDTVYEIGGEQLVAIADFFVELAAASQRQPLEQTIDSLIGTGPAASQLEVEDSDQQVPTRQKAFISPFKEYFFSEQLRGERPAEYLNFLSHLNTLRRHLRNYQTGEQRTLKLADLIDFCDSYTRAELQMVDKSPHREDPDAVQLMTIHGAKGLEFETVFVIGLQDKIWTKSGGSNRFSYPPNLQEIKNSDNQDDDGLRLLFVALTRAKQSLYLNYFKLSEDQKAHEIYSPLLGLGLEPKTPTVKIESTALAEQYEQRWLTHHRSIDKASMKSLLGDQLSNYQLSATHLNNFTNVEYGGPLYFLTQNLLNFPSSMSPKSVFGTVMHSILAKAHQAVISDKQMSTAQLVNDFKISIASQALSDEDKARFIKDGEIALNCFLKQHQASFNKTQKVEFDFKNQGVSIGQARIKGFADLIDTDQHSKEAWVTDYKTGAAIRSWTLPPSAQEYERIKAHHYRQQLLFYKLLIDGANDFGQKGYKAVGGKLVFVEPDNKGKIRTLELNYQPEDVERLKRLIEAVWIKIQNFDFVSTSHYPRNFKGIIQFEDDLIAGKL